MQARRAAGAGSPQTLANLGNPPDYHFLIEKFGPGS
jgi:hypothetical protein